MKKNQSTRISKTPFTLNTIGAAAILLIFAIQAGAQDLDVSETVHNPQLEHINQHALNRLAVADPQAAFEQAFEIGNALFDTAGTNLTVSAPTLVMEAVLPSTREWTLQAPRSGRVIFRSV